MRHLAGLIFACALGHAAPSWACSIQVSMKVVGFDAKNERVLVRVASRDQRFESIRLKVIDLRSWKENASYDIVTSEADDKVVRGKRWQDAEAKLKKDGFTVAPEYPPVEAAGVKLANGVTLKLEGSFNEESQSYRSELVAMKGEKSYLLLRLVGPPSDSKSIENVYLSPDKRWVVAVESGCVNGQTYVFEVASLPKRIAAAEPPTAGP